MTSKLVVNNIGPDVGLSTVTIDGGVAVVGIATATNFKTGTTNVHSTGVELANINTTGGDTKIGAGATIYNSGDVRVSGITTSNTYYGDGSNLTGINATQLGGTLPDARFPANLPVIGGANILSLIHI